MFNNKLEKDCAYCKYGYLLKNGEHIACKKHGMIVRCFNCGSFKYNPLKRIPEEKHPAAVSNFDPENFNIDS